ncbi:MAG: chromate efflux transporter [Caldilineaceae bacterium]|nr:chromate efflux transporter [Caldilineaceae bacterium]
MSDLSRPTEASVHKMGADDIVTFRDAFWVWVKVALYSFGGPAGQIAVMHRLLVEERRWVSENRFLHALNYTMLLPGPEAQQLTVYIGWLLHGYRGGLVAGTLFVLPGFVSILALSVLYAGFQDVTVVAAIFYGLKPAVMAVVVEAVIRIGRRVLKNWVMVGLAALAFVAIFFFEIPFPLLIAFAALIGFIGGKIWPSLFYVIQGHKTPAAGDDPHEATAITDMAAQRKPPPMRESALILVVCLLLWFGPLLILAALLRPDHILVVEGFFFSQAAVVTFGGAYAVLAYIAQQAVEVYGWLQPGEMLDGLGMAETTPGPLIQVVQFVGFMGAYRQPAPFNPMLAGVLGSIVTTWVTFVPCFLWIFLGAPYIESLRGNRSLSTALSAITATVVGVILNLAVWFSIHVLFGQVNEVRQMGFRLLIPVWETLDWMALVIAVAALVAILRFHVSMFKVLAASAVAGILYFLLGNG